VTAFRFSTWFGIVGLFVVMGATVVIALTVTPTDPNPKLQLGLIFGILAVYITLLLFFQRRDVGRAEGETRRATSRAAAEGPRDVEDPTRMSEADLWAAMAVKPIEGEAARARNEMFGPARRSIGLAAIICALIFIGVPPIYLFDTFVPLLVCAPLIALLAVWGSIRAIGSGGEVDQAFDRAAAMMQPLGLELVERPEIRLEPRMPPLWGANARLRGPMLLEGRRHGRSVSVNQEDGGSVTTVKGSTPAFEAKVRGGRFRPGADAPDRVAAALDGIPGSERWRGVVVQGGRGGIVVERKRGREHWLCDLWLAEFLAAQL
jgi:hypothetical protein